MTPRSMTPGRGMPAKEQACVGVLATIAQYNSYVRTLFVYHELRVLKAFAQPAMPAR